MADSVIVDMGLGALTRDAFSDAVISNWGEILTTLYLVAGKDGDKKAIKDIGNPSVASTFSGLTIPRPVREMELRQRGFYKGLVDLRETKLTDGKTMGQRDTMPKMADPANDTVATHFKRPGWGRVERIESIYVYRKDVNDAFKGSDSVDAKEKRVQNLFVVAAAKHAIPHLRWLNAEMLGINTGQAAGPTNQGITAWDHMLGFYQASGSAGLYAGIDRDSADNAIYRGIRITAATPCVLDTMINNVMFKNGNDSLARRGKSLHVILAGGTAYVIMKAQAEAKGEKVVYNGVPEYGQWGFKREAIRYGNTWVVYEPAMPEGKALGLDLSTVSIDFTEGEKFTVTEPYALFDIPGQEDAYTFRIMTEILFAAEDPKGYVWWDNLTI